MIKKLKIKSKPLQEQIKKCTEKLCLCVNFDDLLEDLESGTKGKNVFAHYNLVVLLLIIKDKSELISKSSTAFKLAKLARPFLDSSDPKVRDKASELMARLKDKYNNKI